MGGVRGLAESGIPGVVFAVAYPLSGDRLLVSAAAATVAAVLVLAVGLVQRRPVTGLVSGFFGVILMVLLALWRHDARLFYLLGIYKNAIYAVLYLGSILIGRPLIGVILGPFLGEGQRWRKDAARRRAYTLASWLWVAMFGIRFAIQRALYIRHDVTQLGLVNIVLGIPFFVLICGLTWLILRGTHPVREAEPDSADSAAGLAGTVSVGGEQVLEEGLDV
jgi:hypothetical protein